MTTFIYVSPAVVLPDMDPRTHTPDTAAELALYAALGGDLAPFFIRRRELLLTTLAAVSAVRGNTLTLLGSRESAGLAALRPRLRVGAVDTSRAFSREIRPGAAWEGTGSALRLELLVWDLTSRLPEVERVVWVDPALRREDVRAKVYAAVRELGIHEVILLAPSPALGATESDSYLLARACGLEALPPVSGCSGHEAEPF